MSLSSDRRPTFSKKCLTSVFFPFFFVVVFFLGQAAAVKLEKETPPNTDEGAGEEGDRGTDFRPREV